MSNSDSLAPEVTPQVLELPLTATEGWKNKRVEEVFDLDLCAAIPCIAIRWEGDQLVIAAPEFVQRQKTHLFNKLPFKYRFVSCESEEITSLISLIATRAKLGDTRLDSPKISLTSENSIAQVVDGLIERAVLSRSSDMHFEPFDDRFRVRIRVDGRLQLLAELPMVFAAAIVSRIKVLSQLNIVERRRPQDGQFSTTIIGRRVDVRVATSATLYGEKVVLRLHDERRPLVSLTQLGMREEQLTAFKRAVSAVNGLIVLAGPTGSGKTTTLHSALRATITPFKNVTTIEDPIEYIVDEINQIPVSDAAGTGFAVQLRALLRSDPDVILVGEVRDAETARISIQAALTGHLVLTSIHATDAVGAIYRLMQMDIEPHLVASSLRAVVSQRLLRRVCKFCKVAYKPTKQEKLILDSYDLSSTHLSRGEGCVFCNQSGYMDRVAAYQLLEVSEEIAESISSRPEPVAFRNFATSRGLTKISTEALILAEQGITTLQEALEFLEQHD